MWGLVSLVSHAAQEALGLNDDHYTESCRAGLLSRSPLTCSALGPSQALRFPLPPHPPAVLGGVGVFPATFPGRAACGLLSDLDFLRVSYPSGLWQECSGTPLRLQTRQNSKPEGVPVHRVPVSFRGGRPGWWCWGLDLRPRHQS